MDATQGRLTSRIGFIGAAELPPPGTYMFEPDQVRWAPVWDAGEVALDTIEPLIRAALCDLAFASEAGPLTTWSN